MNTEPHELPEPLSAPAALPMHVLFTDRFMSIYTKFSSFAEMVRGHYNVTPELTVVDYMPSSMAVSDVLQTIEQPLVAGARKL